MQDKSLEDISIKGSGINSKMEIICKLTVNLANIEGINKLFGMQITLKSQPLSGGICIASLIWQILTFHRNVYCMLKISSPFLIIFNSCFRMFHTNRLKKMLKYTKSNFINNTVTALWNWLKYLPNSSCLSKWGRLIFWMKHKSHVTQRPL